MFRFFAAPQLAAGYSIFYGGGACKSPAAFEGCQATGGEEKQ
jgi:hypothetical protein